jgi:MoaA/NifB/PqqE/SkfB family radical SAM enzyme
MTPRTLPSSFCLAPFHAIRQDPFADVGCCTYGGGGGPLGALSVEDRWKNSSLNELRTRFLEGKKPKGSCQRCFLEEAVGKPSCRQKHLAMFPEDVNLVHSGKFMDGPSIIVFQTSNICNLACRTCRAADTNQYNEEGKFYRDEYGETSDWYLRKKPDRHVTKEDLFQYAQISANLKRVEFFGGEPLMNKTHWTFLKELVRREQSRDVTLYYSTNGTLYPPVPLIELWSHFKAVQLGLSIDGIHEQFHYVRYPGNWEGLNDNIRKFKNELPSMMGQTQFSMWTVPTVSALNVYYVPEIYEWSCSAVGDCRLSVAHEPAYYSPKNLPPDVKETVVKKLNQPQFEGRFNFISAFMLSEEMDLSSMQKFFVWTQRKDLYRKQSFAKVFPEYFEILRPYHDQYTRDLTEPPLWRRLLNRFWSPRFDGRSRRTAGQNP